MTKYMSPFEQASLSFSSPQDGAMRHGKSVFCPKKNKSHSKNRWSMSHNIIALPALGKTVKSVAKAI